MNLEKCKSWQDQCRINFAGELDYENRVNCLSNYGVNKTAEFCTEQLNQHLDVFRYSLQHKYQCLTSPLNDFKSSVVSEAAGECINLYYDFQMQSCFQQYEYDFGQEMGFVGDRERPEEDNALAYQSQFWSKYGNLTMSIEDQKKLDESQKAVVELDDTEELVELTQEKVIIEVTDQALRDFLCQRTQMAFNSNPFD